MKTKLALLCLGTATALTAGAQAPVTTNEIRLPDGTVTNRDALLRDILRRTTNPPTNMTPPTVPMSTLPITNRPVRPVPTTVPSQPSAPTVPATRPANLVPPAPQAPTLTPPAPAAPTVTVAPSAPPAPAAPGAPTATLAKAPETPAAPEAFYEPGLSKIQGMGLEQFLSEIYAPAVEKTLLRPASLPDVKLSLTLKNKLTKTEFIQMLDHLLALNGISTVPVGEKFITVIAEAQAGQQAAKFNTKESKDLPEAAQFITQVVQLKYVRPSQLTPILTPFQKNANAIVPFEDTGVLVIRDYAINVKRMLEIIEKVDVVSSFDIVDELIPIKYALAGDIASVLGQLAGGGVATGGSTRSQGVPGTPSAISTRRAGGSVSGSFNQPGAGGIGSVGGVGGIGQQSLGGIGGFGGTSGVGGAGVLGGTRTDFQNRLTQLVQRATSGTGDFQLLGEVKIIPDERTNSLLVFATRADMTRIKDIISKLDVVLAQVLIEALILDVNLSDDFLLSFTYGQRPQTVNDNKIGGVAMNNGALSTGQQFLQQVLTNGIANYPTGDGLAYFGNINDKWDMAVSALSKDNNFKVLARPRVQTSHAVPASIFVGETRPYVTGTFFNGGLGGQGSSSQYQQTQIGLTLQVLPLINQEGLVVMDIQQQVQQIGGFEEIDGNRVPITQDENSSAKVAVRDRETIILGGFIRDAKSETRSGVPYLKDIPLLGYLFRSTTDRNERRELLVLIRPTVLATPEAAALKAQEIRTEMPTVNQVEKDIREREQKLLKKSPPPKTTQLQ